jgi:hypothetical protein
LRLWDRGPEIDRLERIGPRRDPISMFGEDFYAIASALCVVLRAPRSFHADQFSSRLSAYTVYGLHVIPLQSKASQASKAQPY